MWGWSPDGKLLRSLGAEGFLGSVRCWRCLEGDSLTRARRPELMWIPGVSRDSRWVSGPRRQVEGLPALGGPSPPIST